MSFYIHSFQGMARPLGILKCFKRLGRLYQNPGTRSIPPNFISRKQITKHEPKQPDRPNKWAHNDWIAELS